jgi:ATP-binding cassette, subfamily C, bacterial
MTDNRALSASNGDGVSSGTAEAERPSQKPDAEAAAQHLLHRLDQREHVLNRTVKEIDGVIDQLRGAAAASTRQHENRADPAAPFPFGRSATTA